MDESITLYLDSLREHKAQKYKNMKIVPLMGPDSMLEYIVFDEALKQGLKVKETGTVQKLNLMNSTGKEILLLQGEYILGGAQNRMISQNIYLSQNFNGEVPVNCVQRGRWTLGSPKEFNLSPDRVPRKVYSNASRGQGAVWQSVNFLASDYGTHSSTDDYHEIKSHKSGNIDEYVKNFRNVRGAVGMLVAIDNNGQISYSADIFDHSSTMEKYFQKLLKSYAAEAVSGGNNITHENVKEFLSKINAADSISQKPISLGTDFKIESHDIEGSALLIDGLPVYINAGTKYNNGKNSGPETGIGRGRIVPLPFPPWNDRDPPIFPNIPRDGDWPPNNPWNSPQDRNVYRF